MYRIAVLVSGNGTNLQAIMDAIDEGNLNCFIEYVIADRNCYAIERAKKRGIKTAVLDKGLDLSDKILQIIGKDLDLIVLAGFLSILKGDILKVYENKIINIHPSLLPKFSGKGMYGIKVHEAVLKSGEKETGCSVHFIDEGIDTGKILLQEKVPVFFNDTPYTLSKRVLEREHDLIVKAIKMVLEG
ncbi:phosphoribosylglycinamide formyltransferase-1 [Caloramator fervidus]|uniref:Phosphoribosylglycinamide formyltransferase n=1 Tax=Caloramator fervidus TaxID=29344 RepID=A0A1H5RS35_9CLOT|nr:phosphoribosylglycinamide formyltransferase [Caloramator fervidus]SEF41143.1 phosphoribosylglycinamide formyltransferase-1 [Caloramator fervidus]